MKESIISERFTLSGYQGRRFNEGVEEDLIKHFTRLSDKPTDIVGQVIRLHFPETIFTLLLNHMVEQMEDIFDVLIDNQRVIRVEVPRGIQLDATAIEFEVKVAKDYRRARGRFPFYFDVALKLMRRLLRNESQGDEDDVKRVS